MPTGRVIFPEWRLFHRDGAYPFAEGTSRVNAEGRVIPDSVFVDGRLHPVGGLSDMYLSAVTLTAGSVEIEVSDDNGAVASCEVDLSSPPQVLSLQDELERPSGVLVLSSTGALETFSSWSPGRHEFLPSQTRFDAAICIPQPQSGVRGFQIPDGSVFWGNVYLVGERGVAFTVTDDDEIRMDVAGDPLFRRRVAQENGASFSTPRFVKTVNNLDPDSRGDMQITPGSNLTDSPVLRINPMLGGLKIKVIDG